MFIREECKWQTITNVLAYNLEVWATAMKSFIVYTPWEISAFENNTPYKNKLEVADNNKCSSLHSSIWITVRKSLIVHISRKISTFNCYTVYYSGYS